MPIGGEPVAMQLEGAAQVAIQVNERGHGPRVSSQGAVYAGRVQQAERRLVGAGTLLRGQRGAVIEDPVSVVIHAGDHVIRVTGRSIKLAGERELSRKIELPDGKQPVGRLPRGTSRFPMIGV